MTPSRVDSLLRGVPSRVIQMWRCGLCGNERQWGFGKPDNRHRIVLLTCGCSRGEHVRHEYHGLEPAGPGKRPWE